MDIFVIIGYAILGFIMIFFLVVLYRLIRMSTEFQQIRQEVHRELYEKRGEAMVDPVTLALAQREAAPSQRQDMTRMKNGFDKACADYLTWNQTIPIFPLLGILGTVIGLVGQVAAQDAEAIYSNLGSALYTTIGGLVAAIILKMVVAFLHTRVVFDIENMFSEYELRFQDAIAMKNYTNGAEE